MKKKVRMILLTLGLVVGMGFGADTVNAEDGGLAFVKAKNQIVIRENPDVESKAVAYLEFHDAVWINEIIKGEWCEIVSGNAKGFVKIKRLITGSEAEELAKELGHEIAVIYPENLNVREWADSEADTFTVVHENEQYPILGYENEWILIQLSDGSAGYIHSDYCTIVRVYNSAEQIKGTETEQTDEVRWEETEADDTGYKEEYATAAAADNADDSSSGSDQSYEELTDAASEAYSNDTYTAEQYYDNSSVDAYDDDSCDYGYDDTPVTAASDVSTTGSTSGTGNSIVDYATQFVGNPYVYGGTSLTDGADCSGFTQSVMANFGIDIPRVAADQETSGSQVDMDNLKEGDLLFYNQDGTGVDHVAIYIGNNQIVHASDENTGIIITDMNYGSTPVSAVSYTE